MADEMKDGSDVKDENSDVGSGAGSRVLGMTGLSCRKEGENKLQTAGINKVVFELDFVVA